MTICAGVSELKYTSGIKKTPNIFEYKAIITKFALRFLRKHFIKNTNMIVIPVKEGENVERALKRFKRKFEKTGVVKELRSRQAFTKPSVLRRKEVMKAIYIQKLQREED